MRTSLLFALLFAASAAVAQEGTTTSLPGGEALRNYPLNLGERGLVLPHMVIEGTPEFTYYKVDPNNNLSSIGIRVGVGIGGIADVNAITGFIVDPESKWDKTLTGEVRVLAYDSRDLDVAGIIRLPFDLDPDHTAFTGGMVGASTRYRFNNIIYVYGLRDLAEFGTKYGAKDEFSLGLNGTFGVGVDPMPRLSLELQTTVAHIGVTGTIEQTRWWGADFIPVAALVNYAVSPYFDVYAGLQMPDLKNGADSMLLGVGLNARL